MSTHSSRPSSMMNAAPTTRPSARTASCRWSAVKPSRRVTIACHVASVDGCRSGHSLNASSIICSASTSSAGVDSRRTMPGRSSRGAGGAAGAASRYRIHAVRTGRAPNVRTRSRASIRVSSIVWPIRSAPSCRARSTDHATRLRPTPWPRWSGWTSAQRVRERSISPHATRTRPGPRTIRASRCRSASTRSPTRSARSYIASPESCSSQVRTSATTSSTSPSARGVAVNPAGRTITGLLRPADR